MRALVDRNAEGSRALSRTLHVSNDGFIRTATDRRHLEGARRFWDACVRAGDVYKRAYRGLYCVRCERFYTAEELRDGRCPEHKIPPEVVEEENYFFRLSRYTGQLVEQLDSVARGLTDFSISRTKARARGWGIPVPGDPDLVTCANRTVEETKPCVLARAEREGHADARRPLDSVLWDLAECCRLVAEALRPLLPETAERVAVQLGVRLAPKWSRAPEWGGVAAGTRVGAPAPLFPKPAPPLSAAG